MQRFWQGNYKSNRRIAQFTKLGTQTIKTLLYKQNEMQMTFQCYYKRLYTQPHLEDGQRIGQFLESLNLPTLSENQNTKLIAEIAEEELNVISRLKANKSPGPDIFSSEWYKILRSELVPSLLQTFNAALKEGKIPPSWGEATIAVIPKG